MRYCCSCGEPGCKYTSHKCAHTKESDTEEDQNNEQVDRAARMEMTQMDLDWEYKGELSHISDMIYQNM